MPKAEKDPDGPSPQPLKKKPKKQDFKKMTGREYMIYANSVGGGVV